MRAKVPSNRKSEPRIEHKLLLTQKEKLYLKILKTPFYLLRQRYSSAIEIDDERVRYPADLHEVLERLVPFLGLSDEEEQVAYYIVYNIDSGGKLRIDASELSEKFDISETRAGELIELVLSEFAHEINQHSSPSYASATIVPDITLTAERVEVARIEVRDPVIGRALEMREETLRRIGELVRRANEYFLLGYRKYPQTLTMVQVARELGLSVSTISRAVSGKYASTPRGTFPLRIFFGKGPNREFVLHELRELLRIHKDLTDHQLSLLLKSVGLNVSRRTVNKYRNIERNAGGRRLGSTVE